MAISTKNMVEIAIFYVEYLWRTYEFDNDLYNRVYEKNISE
ncbi:hypothetical protein [Staphylococcus gallinarum]|nr:hypothetical protein [Staphylococcus gallinarum]